jgi:hypothetical protein
MASTKVPIKQVKDLTAGDAAKILQVNGTGTWVADYLSNSSIGVGVIGLNKINQGNALTGQLLHWSGSSWLPKSKSLDVNTASLGINQVDNLGLSNLSNNDVYIVSADSVTPAYITGVGAVGISVGKVVKLHYGYVANQAQNPAFFLTGDTPSTAANRINNGQWSIIPLVRGSTLELMYSSSRWNVLSAPALEGQGIYSYSYSPVINTFDSDTAAYYTAGGVSFVDLVSPEVGVGTSSFKLTTGTTSTAEAGIFFYGPIGSGGGTIKVGEGSYLIRATVYVPTASDATNNFELSLFLSPVDEFVLENTVHDNSYSIRHTFGVNSSNYSIHSRDASAETQDTFSALTQASDKVYTYEMLVLPSRTVIGYVNGKLMGIISATPPAIGTNLAPGLKMRRTAGTLARSVHLTSLTVHSLQTPTL